MLLSLTLGPQPSYIPLTFLTSLYKAIIVLNIAQLCV